MHFSRLIAFVVAALIATPSLATDVGGPIVTDTTWTLAGSPYIVTNAIIVGGNATLTIDPGVTVKFNAGLGITVGSQAWGVGTVEAIGTASQKITFTSNTNPGQPGQWKDLFFTDRSIDAVFDGDGQYLSGSTLQHCIVEFAGGGTADSGAVTVSQSSPLISSCEIRRNARSGIYASNTSPPPVVPELQIKDSNIHHNITGGGPGGGAYLDTTGLVLIGNSFTNNSCGSAFFGSGGGGGVHAVMTGSGTKYIISGNTLLSNTANVNGHPQDSGSSGGGGLHIGVYSSNATIYVADNTASHNMTTGRASFHSGGGGFHLLVQGSSNTVTLSGNTSSNNNTSLESGNFGGGLYVHFAGSSMVGIEGNTIIGNTAMNGGGVCLTSFSAQSPLVRLLDNVIANNLAQDPRGNNGNGGGVYVETSARCCPSYGSLVVDLVSNNISGNEARGGAAGGSGLGGAIYVTELLSSQTTAINLMGNQSTGIFNVLSGNTADFGDAIYNNMLYDKNGANDIQAGYVCWGGLDPNPTASPNLIYDFFDNPQKSFVIYPPHVSGPNCTPAPGCGPGLIRDCNGNCAPVSWIGDGYCDDGYYTHNGVAIYFNCQQFGNDGGDCAAPRPPIMNPPNHDVPETPPQYNPPEPPTPGQDKLIFITHGWRTTQERYDTFWVPLADAIRKRVSSDWQVVCYPWVEASQTPLLLPDIALHRAVVLGNERGQDYASQIANQQRWRHVHLIGHSAGAAMIAQMAKRIDEADTLNTATIHTTFLDAFAGAIWHLDEYQELYGGHSDWSDYYRSLEVLDLSCALQDDPRTGDFTQLVLPETHCFDVTFADPDLDPVCLSSHGWPSRFFRNTVKDAAIGVCGVPVLDPPLHGFSLSYAVCGGDVQDWLSNVHAGYPHDDQTTLGPSGSIAEPSMAFQTRDDPAMDLGETPNFPSSPEAVQTVAGVLTMTTRPLGAPKPSPGWINFQISTTTPANFISFDLAFTGEPGAAGLLTMYVNGTKCGVVDEPYTLPGSQHYALPTPGELAPGEHFLSFRLDHFNAMTSSVTIQNVATGLGEFVPACRADFNTDGSANSQDFFDFLAAFFKSDPAADFNRDTLINSQDFFDFLAAFFAGC
jgi:hypothetical protein